MKSDLLARHAQAGYTSELFQTVDFLLEVAAATCCQAISLPAAGTIFFRDTLDPTLIKQAPQGAIQRPGTEDHSAFAHLPHVTQNGVTVARLLGKAEQDEKDGLGDWEGFHSVLLPQTWFGQFATMASYYVMFVYDMS